VLSGHWPLFRYHPDLAREGKNSMQLDSKAPTLPLRKYIYNETRYTMLAQSQPEAAEQLLELAQQDVARRWKLDEHLAPQPNPHPPPPPPAGERGERKEGQP